MILKQKKDVLGIKISAVTIRLECHLHRTKLRLITRYMQYIVATCHFFITQTTLSYLLSGDIELSRMRVDKIAPSEMNITLSTGSPYGNERIKEIVTLFDEYANHTRPLTKLSYKCNYNYASLSEKEIQLELSNGVMETLSIESSSTNEVQRLLEEQLVLPSKPQNNLSLRVRAASRRQEMLRLG